MSKYNISRTKIALALLMFFSLFFVGAISSHSFEEGLGADYSQTDFAVVDEETFAEVCSLAQTKDFSGKTIRLFCDVDLNDLPSPYSPASFYFVNFAGTFEGNGHTVSGCVKNPFGSVAEGGTVKNLVLADCDLTSSSALAATNRGVVSGVSLHGKQTSSNVSGVVSANYGRIENVRILSLKGWLSLRRAMPS